MSASAVVGVGIDVADPRRFARLLRPGSDRAWVRWFTAAEAGQCRAGRDPASAAAVLFAVKEAVYKALGADYDDASHWREIEVLHDDRGYRVAVHGVLGDLARRRGVARYVVSTARLPDQVLATVIAQTWNVAHTDEADDLVELTPNPKEKA